jgi:hypothetical protein
LPFAGICRRYPTQCHPERSAKRAVEEPVLSLPKEPAPRIRAKPCKANDTRSRPEALTKSQQRKPGYPMSRRDMGSTQSNHRNHQQKEEFTKPHRGSEAAEPLSGAQHLPGRSTGLQAGESARGKEGLQPRAFEEGVSNHRNHQQKEEFTTYIGKRSCRTLKRCEAPLGRSTGLQASENQHAEKGASAPGF